MTSQPPDEKPLGIRSLIGVGLDRDGDVRITRGENFYLLGGTEPTHQRMVETARKFSEKVEERGKDLQQINARELDEITRELRED